MNINFKFNFSLCNTRLTHETALTWIWKSPKTKFGHCTEFLFRNKVSYTFSSHFQRRKSQKKIKKIILHFYILNSYCRRYKWYVTVLLRRSKVKSKCIEKKHLCLITKYKENYCLETPVVVIKRAIQNGKPCEQYLFSDSAIKCAWGFNCTKSKDKGYMHGTGLSSCYRWRPHVEVSKPERHHIRV